MKIELSSKKAKEKRISDYTDRTFTINNQVYSSSIIVTASGSVTTWSANRLVDITAQHIEALVLLKPEIIIIGSGKRTQFLSDQCAVVALSKGIGIESMDSGAACRCYNVLKEEGRAIVAGLLLVGAD